MPMMKAAVFVEPGRIVLQERPKPQIGPTDALMRRLMTVIGSDRVDLGGLVAHRYKLDQIEAAYELFANQRDGVLKIAITP
jgi:hypothetical protein